MRKTKLEIKMINRFLLLLLILSMSLQVFGCGSDLTEEDLAEIEAYSNELMGELQDEMEDFYENYYESWGTGSNDGSMNSSIKNLDKWSFRNSEVFFEKEEDGYFITWEDYWKLVCKLTAKDKDSVTYTGNAKGTKFRCNIEGSFPSLAYGLWGGSCYGMSVIANLINNGELNVSAIDSTSTKLNEVEDDKISAKIDKRIQSIITFYHMQQYLPKALKSKDEFMEWSQISQLEYLEYLASQCANTGKTIGISFNWIYLSEEGRHSTSGHRVVGYGIETGSWSSSEFVDVWEGIPDYDFTKRILIYDCAIDGNPNFNEEDFYLYYNDLGVFCIPGWGVISTSSQSRNDYLYNNAVLSYVGNDEEMLNLVDYSTGEKSSVLDKSFQEIVLKTMTDISFYVKSNNGTATVENGSVTNSNFTDVLNVLIGESIMEDGNIIETDAVLFLKEVDECEITTEEDSLDFSVENGDYKTTVSSDSSGTINFGTEGQVTVNTNNKAENYIRLTADNGINGLESFPTIEIINEGTVELSVSNSEDGIIVESDNLEDLSIIGNNYTDVVEVNTGSSKDSVLISSDGSSIYVSEDSDGDGEYDEVIAEENKKISILEFDYDKSDDDPPGGGSGEIDTIYIIAIIGGVVVLLIIIVVAVTAAGNKNKKQQVLQNMPITPQNQESEVSETTEMNQVQRIAEESEKDSISIGVQFLSGSRNGEKIGLREGEVAGVGKDPVQAGIVIDRNFVNVSRLHCTITYSAQFDKYFVIDASSNGTFIENGERLQKGKRTPIERQTIISLAGQECKIKLL